MAKKVDLAMKYYRKAVEAQLDTIKNPETMFKAFTWINAIIATYEGKAQKHKTKGGEVDG